MEELIPVMAVLVGGAMGVAFLAGPIGRAIGNRIAGRTSIGSGPDDDTRTLIETMEGLRDDIDALRQDVVGQVNELHERVDFAERLLARNPRADAPSSHEKTPV